MDLQTRQRIERNRIGRMAAVIISIAVMIMTFVDFRDNFGISAVLTMAICVFAIAFNYITYSKLHMTEKYIHCCCSSMIAIYITVILFFDDMVMYAVLYPIGMLVMIFANTILTAAGSIVALLGAIVFFVKLISVGSITTSQMIIPIILAITTCFIGFLVTSLQNRLSHEAIEEVKEQASYHVTTSKRIVELANDLNNKFYSAKEVSQKLSDSVNTSNSSVSDIALSTRVNAEQIEQQTGKTADIQKSINAVGSEAKLMGEISERTNATVEEGVELVRRLKMQASEVAKINTETKETTEKLNESIQDVQDITQTILGISSQTNLLALNASIEAARAGDAGKGFAVVAEEIRKLSEDTRKATEQISIIIEKLTNDAIMASESMAESTEVAQKQNELIEETGEKLTDIKSETDSLYDGVLQVNESVQDIITANTIIMDSIQNLSATSQQVAASSDTALSISDTTKEALENMNGLLGDISCISQDMETIANT